MNYLQQSLLDEKQRNNIQINKLIEENNRLSQSQKTSWELEELIKYHEEQANNREKQTQAILEENENLKSQIINQNKDNKTTLNAIMEKLDEMKTVEPIDSTCSIEANAIQQYPQYNTTNASSLHLQPQWQFYPSHFQLNGNAGAMEIENKKQEITREKVNHSNQPSNSNQRRTKNDKKKPNSHNEEKRFTIPWKGKILTPTANELRKFEGNLNNIQTHLGYREPNERGRQFKDIRIRWKGQTLKPTPRQLLQSKGILNELLYMSKSNKETEFFPPNKSSKRKVEKNPQTRGGSQ